MKQRAIIMVPTLIEFENPGSIKQVKNHALTLCSKHQSIIVDKVEYAPKLLLISPLGDIPDQPLVFDPPPMAA